MSTDRRQLLNDLETSLTLALNGRQSRIWTAIPCIIISVNLLKMTLEAQPTILGEVELADGTTVYEPLPLLVDVPICFPSGGGFLITLPLKPLDEVLVIFASRCIDSWWQSGGVQKAAEFRMHDLSDGFAIPGPRSLPKVATAISATALQIRNDLGTSYVEISAAGAIKLVSPLGITLMGPLTVTGSSSFTGSMTVTGTVTATGEIMSGIIPLTLHTHISGTPGNPTGPAQFP